jgi:hypothetical protein
MSKRVLLSVVSVMLLLAASPAFATVVIDFEQGVGAGGTVTVSGGNASTTDIPVDILKVAGTGATDGVYDLTGTCSGAGQDGNGSACLAFNTAAGTISITGGVVGLAGLPNGTLLLNGTFSSSSVSASSVLLVVSGTGPDTKDATLLSDLNTTGPFNFFGFSLDAGTPTAGTYIGTSNDIINTGVPEPASAALLGGVLLIAAGALRRKSKRA